MQPWFHGDYVLILRDGTRVNSSKGYRRRLREILCISGGGKTEPFTGPRNPPDLGV